MGVKEVVLRVMMCVAAGEPEISLVPAPVKLEPNGNHFVLDETTRILFQGDNGDARQVAEYLGRALRPATGCPLAVSGAAEPAANAFGLRVEEWAWARRSMACL